MRTRHRVAWIISGLVLGTIILRLVGAFQPLEDLVRMALLPLARLFSVVGTGTRDLVASSPSAEELRERNLELEARLSSLTVDYVRLRALEEENRSLQALTKFLSASGYDQVPARVIARSIDPRSATVTIDRGSKDGVETGMAVVVEEGIFVGKVTGLRDRISIVTLVADEHSRIAASRGGEHRLLGLVEGRGNNVARLTLVPQMEELKRDDIIVTAGTEDKIPANLAIGLVNEVEGKPTDPFQSAALEPLAHVDRVSLVSVLRPSALRPETEAEGEGL